MASPVTVVEMPDFARDARRVWREAEVDEFIDYIARNPLAGVVVPGAGGFRKVRWSAPGRGKRGGSRIIYFFFDENYPLLLTSFYLKSAKSDLSRKEVAALNGLAIQIKQSFRHRGT
jgi:hypothetical protein